MPSSERQLNNEPNVLSSKYASASALNEFKTYFNQRGFDCFNYDQTDKNLQGIFLVTQEVGYEMLRSYCLKINKPDLIEKCVIDYVSHNQFQAYATMYNDYYFIGISAALPALLQTMFQNLFCFTNPLTDTYGFEQEKSDEETFYVFPDQLMSEGFKIEQLRLEIDDLIKDTIPVERWQRIMASKLAELAICFCIAHEIGHIVSGHTDIVNLRAANSIEETPSLSSIKHRRIGSWLSQSFEVQADRIGMALLYSYSIGTKKHRKKFMHYLRCRSDDKALYGMVLYSVYLVFLLLGQQHYIIETKGSHPAPITRVSFLMAFLATIMVDRDGHDSQEAGDTVEKYAEMAEAAWQRIGFSTGRNEQTIDDLPSVVKELSRADELVKTIFGKYQWAVKYRAG